jgi:hypothetical protein
LDVEVAILNRPSPPDDLDDLISRDEVAWLLDQHAENVERPAADHQRHENTLLIPPEQHAATPVKAEILE